MTPTTDPRPEQIRQIAEKVMGWCWNTIGQSGSFWVNRLPFNPFLNATHCEMLMDRMRELGYCLTLTILVDGKCTALFYRDRASTSWRGSLAADWRTAVSLAALEAMK